VILGIVNIDEFYYILVVELLHNGYFIVEKIDICNIHTFQFDDFNSIPGIFVFIFDAFIDFTSKSTSDEVFEVEAVRSDPLFAFMFVLYFILFITLINVDGAICTRQMQITTFLFFIFHRV
jgi:hypothetical protein